MSALFELTHEELVRKFNVPGNAEFGELLLCDVVFPAARWTEDGGHFVISLDADVSGQGDDWDEAFQSFFEAAGDVVVHISEMLDDATEYERQTLVVLTPRLAMAYSRMEAMIEVLERRRLNLRRKHHRQKTWRSPQTPANSSRLLPA